MSRISETSEKGVWVGEGGESNFIQTSTTLKAKTTKTIKQDRNELIPKKIPAGKIIGMHQTMHLLEVKCTNKPERRKCNIRWLKTVSKIFQDVDFDGS